MVHVYIIHDSLAILTSKLIMNHYYSRKLSLELRDFFQEPILERILYVYRLEENDCDL